MSDDRKFYCTTLTIRVLAEGEPWDGNLQWLSHDITEGEYVGDLRDMRNAEVTAERMGELLIDAGSDMDFFAPLELEPPSKTTYVVTAEGTELE